MNRNDRYLTPGMHPSQILLALKLWVDATKFRCGLPVRAANLTHLVQVWEQARWDAATNSKGFGLVCGSYIPCRMVVIPDHPHPFIQLDPAAFDEYYGHGAAYTALVAYRDRRSSGATAEGAAAALAEEAGIPGPVQMPLSKAAGGSLPDTGNGRAGVKAARKAGAQARSTMEAVNALAALVGFHETEQAPVLPPPVDDRARLDAMSPEERRADNARWFKEAMRKRPATPADLAERDAGLQLLSPEEQREQEASGANSRLSALVVEQEREDSSWTLPPLD